MDAWKAVVSDGGCQHLAAIRIFSVKTRYSRELSFSWISAGMLVIALQDSVIGKDFKPFWGCLLQSGWLLCWKQTRAKPRASPAGMWQTQLCPLDITEMWSQPKYQISWWNNLCFVFSGQPCYCLKRQCPELEVARSWGDSMRGRKVSYVLALFLYSSLDICCGQCQEMDMTQCHHS